MNDLQRTGGSAKDIATENGGAFKIARDGCSGPSWCELTPSDRRSSSSVHQLASLGVAGGRGHRRVIHRTIERAGGNKRVASRADLLRSLRGTSSHFSSERRCGVTYLCLTIPARCVRITRGRPTSVFNHTQYYAQISSGAG